MAHKSKGNTQRFVFVGIINQGGIVHDEENGGVAIRKVYFCDGIDNRTDLWWGLALISRNSGLIRVGFKDKPGTAGDSSNTATSRVEDQRVRDRRGTWSVVMKTAGCDG